MDDKERLIKVEEQTRINTKKLEECNEEIKELRKTYSIIETMALRVGNVEKTVDSINRKLDEQEVKLNEESFKYDKKNSEKWIKLIDYIFYAILAYALFKLGLK